MKIGIIDIGSNSIRLSVYETRFDEFRILFKEKIMAGLASYVEKGALTEEGIDAACSAILEFRGILDALKITHFKVFATASLRNIKNTEEALARILEETGSAVEVLSGEEEAYLGYFGVMEELDLKNGVIVDIGGASTELVPFAKRNPDDCTSFPVGSLSLYKRCVKKILPSGSVLKDMLSVVEAAFDTAPLPETSKKTIVGIGGTARAAVKLANRYYKRSPDERTMTRDDLETLFSFLTSNKKTAIDFLLRYEADRIHTMIPGLVILRHVFDRYGAKLMVAGTYGVREGYLCRNILHKNMDTHKTEN